MLLQFLVVFTGKKLLHTRLFGLHRLYLAGSLSLEFLELQPLDRILSFKSVPIQVCRLVGGFHLLMELA